MILQKLMWEDDQGDQRMLLVEDESYSDAIRGMIMAQGNLTLLIDEEIDYGLDKE